MKEAHFPLLFIAIVSLAIWGWSSKQILKNTPLRSGARYVHAIGIFPILLFLVVGSVLLGGMVAPSLMDWLGGIVNLNLPFHLEALVVLPVVAPIPLAGIYIWWKFVSKLESVLGS